jgi:ArsR family transcriptional regulator
MSGKKDKASESHDSVPAVNDREILLISKALSDPKRLEVLRKIASCENASCMDLRTHLAINPATLSHHIKQLEGAGLIETHRDGKLVRTTLRRKAWKGYLSHLKQFTS